LRSRKPEELITSFRPPQLAVSVTTVRMLASMLRSCSSSHAASYSFRSSTSTFISSCFFVDRTRYERAFPHHRMTTPTVVRTRPPISAFVVAAPIGLDVRFENNWPSSHCAAMLQSLERTQVGTLPTETTTSGCQRTSRRTVLGCPGSAIVSVGVMARRRGAT
jgi:hypothetical protein